MRGIDVSDNNGVQNIESWPEDIGFAIIKGGEGLTEQDPDFQDTYHQLKRLRPDIDRCQYEYFRWDEDGIGQVQAAMARGVDFKEAGVWPLMLDLEADDGSEQQLYISANLALCRQRVVDAVNYYNQQTGEWPLIYSFDYFLNNVLKVQEWPDCPRQCPLYIASYQANNPPNVVGWAHIVWQYSDTGKLDGETTGGSLDLDEFVGTPEQLLALNHRGTAA